MSTDLKKRAAEAALDLVQDGMILGLGTGSTARFFTEGLAERVRGGLDIQGVPTSKATGILARELGIPLVEPDETTVIDLDVDGADEVTSEGAMIKGGGAALLREKIVASAARRFVLIADASKRVETLGKFPLPVEVEPFAVGLTVRAMREALSELGFSSPRLELRQSKDARGFLETDNGGLVVDCHLERIEDPEAVDRALTLVPGVKSTGLFLGLDVHQLLATEDGFLDA